MAMDVFSYSNRSIKRLIITIALLAIMLRPSLGQSADRNDSLQPLISSLRTCVRANASAAYNADVRTESEAVAFLVARSNATILDELAKAGDVVVPPGLFRVVIRQEWTAFTAGSDNK
jgi:hypothetical protein